MVPSLRKAAAAVIGGVYRPVRGPLPQRPQHGLGEHVRLRPPVADVGDAADAIGRHGDDDEPADVEDDLGDIEQVGDRRRPEALHGPGIAHHAHPFGIGTCGPVVDLEIRLGRCRESHCRGPLSPQRCRSLV
jgi:hypothetical protein